MRLRDLTENFQSTKLSHNAERVLPPVAVLPELTSGNNYPQYRFMTLMAAIRAIKAGEVEYKKLVPWFESLATVGYTKEELETVQMAAKMAGFEVDVMNNSPSHEPDWVQKISPVATFNMTESMRTVIDKLADE